VGRPMDDKAETVKGWASETWLAPLEAEIRKYILREFAGTGRPPTAEEIVKGLGLSSVDAANQTIQNLEAVDLLSTREGRIVSAYPFSSLETPHKVVFEDGHEVYALCATDALGIHFMLDKDITILSKCPECEREIRVVVKAGEIESYDPDGIIEFVSSREGCGCMAEVICPFINFFCSKEHLEEWRKRNPEISSGETYSLSDALEHGRVVFGGLLK